MGYKLASKGEQANESFPSRRLRNLRKLALYIDDVTLTTLANPIAVAGKIVQKTAKKVRDETMQGRS